jgi:hypothetical protein
MWKSDPRPERSPPARCFFFPLTATVFADLLDPVVRDEELAVF